jgi:nicotinamide riboside transporter PnuC
MDWIALTLSSVGIIFNAKKLIICWPIWLLSNVFWTIYSMQTDQMALLVLQIIFGALNIYGWISWKSNYEKNN